MAPEEGHPEAWAGFLEWRSEQWNRALQALEVWPAGAAEKGKGGILPLYSAVAHGAPMEVIRALIGAAPATVSERCDGELPLHAAGAAVALQAYSGREAVVEALVDAYPAGAAQKSNKNGRLPLHMVVALSSEAGGSEGLPGAVQALLQAHPPGAQEKDNRGSTPMHLAAAHQAGAAMDLLLAAHPEGAAVRDRSDNLPLHLAVGKQIPTDVILRLVAAHPLALKESNHKGMLPLHCSAANQAPASTVRALLDAYPEAVAVPDATQSLPLHAAAANQAPLEVVSLLLSCHQEASALKNGPGCLPLHLAAASHAEVEVIEALLRSYPQGAAGKASDARLPLHSAAANNAPVGVVRALLAAYPEGASEGDRGSSLPLHLAATHRASLEVVQALIAAYPQAAAEGDRTKRLPIHLAASNRADVGVLRALHAAHPEGVATPNTGGSTTLHLAAAKQTCEAVQLLLEAHLPAVREKNSAGWLPLHVAAGNQAPGDVVEALLSAYAGAASERNNDGRLPLHMAIAQKAPVEAVAAMLAAHPQGAVERDPTSGNFPLQAVEKAEEAVADAVWAVMTESLECSPSSADAWTALVADKKWATRVGEAVARRPRLAAWKGPRGRTAYDEACGECRAAMDDALAFLGRYRVVAEEHRSATCVVVLARDLKAPEGQREEVALKLMAHREEFLQEVSVRVQLSLSSDFVVSALRVHVDGSLPAVGGIEESLPGMDVHLEPAYQQSQALGPVQELFSFCVVMERAERSLDTAIRHERFAGSDWVRVRSIAGDTLRALHHLHTKGIIHGDLKPQNVMRVGEVWQLIDLDVSCRLGAAFGAKPPSSGFCPPEMARVLLNAEGDTSKLKEYRAAVAYDLWSFGVVLYNMACAVPLWNTDVNDDVLQDDLQLLAAWDRPTLNRKLALGGVDQGHGVLAALLAKLLEANPAVRESHWPAGVAAHGILQDEFFRENKERDALKLDRMLDNQERMLRMQHRMQNQLDSILGHLQAQARMLSTLIKGDRQVPSLVCFLPVAEPTQKGGKWWQKSAASPSQWMNREVELYFVEPVGMTWVEGHGFRLKFQREWVRKAMPYIRVGLAALKTASAASRLAGFPIPNLAGEAEKLIGEQLEMLGSLRDEAMDALCSATGADRDSIGEMMAAVDEHVQGAAASAVSEAAAQVSSSSSDASPAVGKGLQKSAAELARWLDSEHPGWRDNTGLQLAVCKEEGVSEWVLPRDVEDFELQGSKLLGSKTSKTDHRIVQQDTTESPKTGLTVHSSDNGNSDSQGRAAAPPDMLPPEATPIRKSGGAATSIDVSVTASSGKGAVDPGVGSQLIELRQQQRQDMERVQQQLGEVTRHLREVQQEIRTTAGTGPSRSRKSSTNCCIS